MVNEYVLEIWHGRQYLVRHFYADMIALFKVERTGPAGEPILMQLIGGDTGSDVEGAYVVKRMLCPHCRREIHVKFYLPRIITLWELERKQRLITSFIEG